MRYLSKTNSSRILAAGWQYTKKADRDAIREVLRTEQSNYCAYSEDHLGASRDVHVEHFDPRLKGTPADGYWNWYAVTAWMNQHKPHRIDEFEPMPQPHDPTLRQRVRYVGDCFEPCDENDVEVKNLIEFLGMNKREVVMDRCSHVAFVLDTQQKLGMPLDEFVEWLRRYPPNLRFITALEAALDCTLSVAAR